MQSVGVLTDAHVLLGIRIFLGVLLAVTGILKLLGLRQFVQIVADYRLLPKVMVRPVAGVLPRLEVLVGVTMMFGFVPPWPSAAAACLFALFGAAIMTNLLRGRREISCGCLLFGTESRLKWTLVFRNASLAAVALASTGGVFLRSNVLYSTAGATVRLPIWDTVATALVSLGVLAGCWMMSAIRDTLRPTRHG